MTTRERILSAALTCFSEKGYAATTTRVLAKAADVNVATLAYHFGGKEGLYRAAVDSLYERLLDVSINDLGLSGTPAQRTEQLLRFVFRLACANHEAVRLLLRHVLDHGLLPSAVRERWTVGLLERVQELWQATGLEWDAGSSLKLLTLNHLVVRYAISDPQDLLDFVPGDDPFQAIEDHFVEFAF